ncbi:hypothetical protein BCh11DRAFT_04226 [Burkholderia sp. Ch1-1]|nr:hypothetical protein BCh11DRAFT_04226 [Burkholderia sp. Ch1-1]
MQQVSSAALQLSHRSRRGFSVARPDLAGAFRTV